MSDTFAIIWDMDGVLIDTVSLNWFGRRLALSLHDIQISNYEISSLEGRPLEAHFAYFVQAKGLSIPYDEFKSEYTKLSRVLYEEQPPQTSPALRTLLRELQKHEILMAVGTASSRPRAEKLIGSAGLKSYFDCLVTKEEVAEHKPNPATFLKAAQKLGFKPENCVVVEDAANGIRAARTGGMKSVGIVNAFHTAEELGEADMVIHGFDELNYDRLASLMTDTKKDWDLSIPVR